MEWWTPASPTDRHEDERLARDSLVTRALQVGLPTTQADGLGEETGRQAAGVGREWWRVIARSCFKPMWLWVMAPGSPNHRLTSLGSPFCSVHFVSTQVAWF